MQAGMMGQVDWNLLRFYGTLSATQKSSLQKGGPMTFGSLQPNQKALVTTMLFGPETDLSITDNAKQQDVDPFTSMIMKQISRFGPGSSGGDYRTEPTEIMPNGLPSSGYIQVSFSSEPVGVPTGSSSSLGEFSTLGPMELGLLKMFKEDPKMSEMSGGLPTIEGLKVGTRSKYMFNFFVAPDIAQSGNLQDDRIPKDATTYKMNNLPASFQADIDRMAATMKKNPFWSAIGSMGMGRQQQLPPP
jgi:hypothetical protein